MKTIIATLICLSIQSATAVPRLTDSAIMYAAQGSHVSKTIATSEPADVAVTSGLPPGLTFTSPNIISGAPTSLGTFDAEVFASNESGVTTGTLRIVVLAADAAGGLQLRLPTAPTSFSGSIEHIIFNPWSNAFFSAAVINGPTTYGSVTVNPSPSPRAIAITKFDINGVPQWVSLIRCSHNLTINDICPAGGFAGVAIALSWGGVLGLPNGVTMNSYGYTSGPLNTDGGVVSIKSDGTVAFANSISSSEVDHCFRIASDAGGNIVVGAVSQTRADVFGVWYDPKSPGSNVFDSYFVGINGSTGNVTWRAQIASEQYDEPSAVLPLGNGSTAMVALKFVGNANGLDFTGSPVNFNGGSSNPSSNSTVICRLDGGGITWGKVITGQGSEYASSFVPAMAYSGSTSKIFVATTPYGQTVFDGTSLGNLSSKDLIFSSMALTDGTVLSNTIVSGTGTFANLGPYRMAIAPDNSIFLGGSVRGDVDFSPGFHLQDHADPQVESDHCLMAFSQDGAKLWALRDGDSATGLIRQIAVSGDQKIRIIGDGACKFSVLGGLVSTSASRWCSILEKSPQYPTPTTFGDWLASQSTIEQWSSDPSGLINSDANENGISNLVEYSLSAQTTQGGAMTTHFIYTSGTGTKYLGMTFIQRNPLADVMLVPQVASSLAGPWVANQVSVIDRVDLGNGYERVRVRDVFPMSTASRRFLRLSVSLLP